MNDECVVGVYDSIQQAEQAVRILRRGDVPRERISLVASGLKDKPAIAAELKLGDDSVHDWAVGAGLGGILGLLAGLGFAAIPGLGVVFLLGPLAAGAGLTGAVVGADLGSFVGWGVHEDHIRRYERQVHEGKVLVIVNGDPLAIAHAERILKETDVSEVNLHTRTSSDAPEMTDE